MEVDFVHSRKLAHALVRHITLIHATHNPLGLSLTQATEYNRYTSYAPCLLRK